MIRIQTEEELKNFIHELNRQNREKRMNPPEAAAKAKYGFEPKYWVVTDGEPVFEEGRLTEDNISAEADREDELYSRISYLYSVEDRIVNDPYIVVCDKPYWEEGAQYFSEPEDFDSFYMEVAQHVEEESRHIASMSDQSRFI